MEETGVPGENMDFWQEILQSFLTLGNVQVEFEIMKSEVDNLDQLSSSQQTNPNKKRYYYKGKEYQSFKRNIKNT